jgi:hypothetical protein
MLHSEAKKWQERDSKLVEKRRAEEQKKKHEKQDRELKMKQGKKQPKKP